MKFHQNTVMSALRRLVRGAAEMTYSRSMNRRDTSAEIIDSPDPFACFHPVTSEWFKAVFDAPTAPQRMGWPAIARGESALILAPTGTGKTLTAFLWCLDRLMLTDSHPSDKNKGVARMGHPPLPDDEKKK